MHLSNFGIARVSQEKEIAQNGRFTLVKFVFVLATYIAQCAKTLTGMVGFCSQLP